MPSTENYITQAAGDARYQALGSLGATPNTIEPDDAASAGVSASAARADHEHGIVAGTPVEFGNSLSEGVAASFARADHVHTGPRGVLGYAQVTTDITSISAEQDLAGLSVTVTVGSGRRIKITAHVQIGNDATAGEYLGRIFEGANEVGRYALDAIAASRFQIFSASTILTPSAGAHTYKLKGWKFVGAGTMLVDGSPDFPAFILVEDIGAA